MAAISFVHKLKRPAVPLSQLTSKKRQTCATEVIRHCGCRDHRAPTLQGKKPFLTLHFRSAKRKSGWRKKFATGELHSYMSMRSRCYKKNKNGEHFYEQWGGKGVRVCDRWLEPNGRGFQNFLDDMGPRPSCTSLDRVNPQEHYTPLNCKWAHQKNRRFTRPTSCGRTKHRRPFPRFEMRTSKSTTYLEASHTDTLCQSLSQY